MVKLNARCSAFLQNELPPKEKDHESFILPCVIGNTTISNALEDLGASISVMPFSKFKRLGLGNPKPINMMIEMADRSMQSPKGIVENMMVKIHNFIFPVDFIILDIIEDDKVPIILGRPMLATTHAKINVFRLKISLEVVTEQVIFNANNGTSPLTISQVCVIDDYQLIDDLGGPGDLEELLMNEDINGDLGIFLEENRLLLNFDHQEAIYFSPKNICEFVEKGQTEALFGKPFKDNTGLEEDLKGGAIWFKIGNDKTIFNMPRAERRFRKLTTKHHSMMPPIVKISDEYMYKGKSQPYKKIREFYKGCLELGHEYKQDQDMIDWIKNGLNIPKGAMKNGRKSYASLAEGEKNKYSSTKKANLKKNLVDLMGIDVVEEYHKKKLLYDKYYDKMLKKRKSPKITNCNVLTKKGPIALKVYREDGTDEVISNFKVSDP
nr:hypothetical protein [Tanacetum cinerariifolium]